MSRQLWILTAVIQLICWSLVGWILTAWNQSIVQAYPLYQIPPAPFLGPIYYGQRSIAFVFDHEYPLFNGDGEENDWVRHYDGTQKSPPIPTGYGYDSHFGVDYDLVYEPVVASATGNIAFAGWADPDDHRLSYGLHIQMTFDDNTSYRAWYGHLSTLTVETGEPMIAGYDDRKRILGISGNTGYVLNSSGNPCGGSVDDDPLCGAHLHFEVRQISGNKPVNPYGWIGNSTDPWSIYAPTTMPGTPTPEPSPTPGPPPVQGATSYNLWSTKPAVTTGQYGTGGSPVLPPFIGGPLFAIDDDGAFFSTVGNCWGVEDDNTGYWNGSFHYALVGSTEPPPTGMEREATLPEDSTNCYAQWLLPAYPSSYTDAYDVYVHMPTSGFASSFSAVYTIQHANQTDQAVVVQAAYPNSTHDQWAYLGRYQFDFGGGGGPQYVRLGNDVSHNQDEGNLIVADGVIFYPATIDPVGCPVESGEGGLDPGWWVWDAVGVGSGQIEISWEYFWGGGDLDYLLIHRNTTPDFNTAQMVHSEEDTMDGSWVDGGVTDGVLYYYWLSPTYCYGNFETLGPESATTGVIPTPRATPTNAPTPPPTATSTPTPVPLNTGWRNPTGNMASTGGDGDGFEVNGANAYTNNGLFAVDNNSGTLAVSGDVVCMGSHTGIPINFITMGLRYRLV